MLKLQIDTFFFCGAQFRQVPSRCLHIVLLDYWNLPGLPGWYVWTRSKLKYVPLLGFLHNHNLHYFDWHICPCCQICFVATNRVFHSSQLADIRLVSVHLFLHKILCWCSVASFHSGSSSIADNRCFEVQKVCCDFWRCVAGLWSCSGCRISDSCFRFLDLGSNFLCMFDWAMPARHYTFWIGVGVRHPVRFWAVSFRVVSRVYYVWRIPIRAGIFSSRKIESQCTGRQCVCCKTKKVVKNAVFKRLHV